MQNKHFIYADGKLIALNIQSKDEQDKLKNYQTRYLHYDALNSVDLITDGYGLVVERRSYDTWGKQRKVTWRTDDPRDVIQQAITNRGYTGHEEITEVGLVHMNGRVYDQELGRFISPDPIIQAPYVTNSFNRYSYVMNNPLKYTDPSGFRLVEDDPNGRYQDPSGGLHDPKGEGGNGNHNPPGSRKSNESSRSNLEGEGIGFHLGYLGRTISGWLGGSGNTLTDQKKMGAITARAQCRRGRCGESQIDRINGWNAHLNLMYSAGAYVSDNLINRRSLTQQELKNSNLYAYVERYSKVKYSLVYDKNGVPIQDVRPIEAKFRSTLLGGMIGAIVGKELNVDLNMLRERYNVHHLQETFSYEEAYDTRTMELLEITSPKYVESQWIDTGVLDHYKVIDVQGCFADSCELGTEPRGVRGKNAY